METIEDLIEELLKDGCFFIGSSTIFFRDLHQSIESEFIEYSALVEEFKKNDSPFYSFEEYLQEHTGLTEEINALDTIKLWKIHRINYMKLVGEKSIIGIIIKEGEFPIMGEVVFN